MKQFLLTLAGVFCGLLLFFVGLPLLVVAMVACGLPARCRRRPTPCCRWTCARKLTDQDPDTPLAFLNGRARCRWCR